MNTFYNYSKHILAYFALVYVHVKLCILLLPLLFDMKTVSYLLNAERYLLT